jgi:hypothetical protein
MHLVKSIPLFSGGILGTAIEELAMSAEPERVFSSARRTIAWDKCQLGGRTVERGECMKNWIKSGITQGIPVDLVEKNQESKGSKTTVWRASTSDSLDEAG